MQEIEDFLMGRLGAEERILFKQKLLTDPSLAVEVELYREIARGTNLLDRAGLKQRLQQLEDRIRKDLGE